MKIFSVYQNIVYGFDTFDSFVIICEDEEIARKTDPHGQLITWEDDTYSWVGLKNIDKVEIEYLGEAKEGSERGIVCASFNAG